MTIKIYQLGLAIATLTAVAALWFLLAPPVLGGGTTYSITRGTSMSPYFKGGDLVVMRRSSHYSVGEIAAYRNHDFNRVVMHRIIRRDGSDYVFKGDNNNYVDSARVTKADVVGRLWFHIPGVGRVLASARAPFQSVPLIVLGLLLLLLPWPLRKARHSFRSVPKRTSDARKPAATGDGVRRSLGNTVLFGGLAGLFGIAFLFALLLPASRHSAPQTYEQRGAFSYSAAPTGAAGVYPTGRVTTGDPIFLRLVGDLRVAYDYRFRSTAVHTLDGTASLHAVLQSPEGWKHDILLQGPRPFHGDSALSAGTLHLDRLRTLIARFQAATGVTDATYTLTVSPLVAVHGTIARARLVDGLSTPLLFQLDSLELRVVPPQTLGSGPPPDPYVATRATPVPATAVPALVGPFASSVFQLRLFALLACALSLLAAFACGLPSFSTALRRNTDRVDLPVIFGDRLIEVGSTRRALSRRTVVDVPDARSLIHLADGLESPILHDVDDDVYLLEGDPFIYRYAPVGHSALYVVDARDVPSESAPSSPPVSDAFA